MGTGLSEEKFPTVKKARERCSEEEWRRYERSFTKLTRLNKGKLPLDVYQKQVLPFLPADLIQVLFNVFDQHQTGFLNKDEFLVGTTLVAHGTRREKLRILFRMYDRTKTGKLTARDLRPFLKLFQETDPETNRLVLSYFKVEYSRYSRYGIPVETELDFEDWEDLFEQITASGTRKLPLFNWIFGINEHKKEQDGEKWDSPEKFWVRSNSLSNITSFDKRELAELETFWENNLREESIDKGNLEIIESFFHHEIPKELLQQVFESFDPLKKGCISTRDFIVGLSACVRGTEEDKLRFAFHAYAGQDNTLDAASLSEMLKALWTLIDLKEDQSECEGGDDSSTEMKVLKLHRLKTMNNGLHSDQAIPALVRSIFKHYDVNEDGEISFKEFRNWTIDNPTALDFVNTLSAVASKYWLRPTTRDEEGLIVEEFMAEMAELKEGSKYYIIDTKWFQLWAHWANFGYDFGKKKTKEGDSGTISLENTKISDHTFRHTVEFDGGAVMEIQQREPGAIDNSLILTLSSTTELKPNLTVDTDFLSIPEKAWIFLVRWYGGGPPIPRYARSLGNPKVVSIEHYPLLFSIQVFEEDTRTFDVQISRTFTLEKLAERIADNLRVGAPQIKLYRINEKEEMQVIDESRSTILEDTELDYGELIVVEKANAKGEFGEHKKSFFKRSKNLNWLTRQQSFYEYNQTRELKQSNASWFGGRAISGRCGLFNLGNTCFMNSALQALLHCPPLQRYFRSEMWKMETSDRSDMGTRGKLPVEFGYLMDKVWDGNECYAAPRRLRKVICRSNTMFGGYQQHDSQEFLNIMLDLLGEDLNRVLEKGYVELPDSGDRDDSEVAIEWLNSHLIRNSSIINDLFMGQFKSCTKWDCGRENNTFNPYMMLSLSLPEPRDRVVTVTVVFDKPSVLATRYSIKVGWTETAVDVRESIGKMSGVEPTRMMFAENHKGSIHLMGEVRQIQMEQLVGRDGIFVFEIPQFRPEEAPRFQMSKFKVGALFDVFDTDMKYRVAKVIGIHIPRHLRREGDYRDNEGHWHDLSEEKDQTPPITHPGLFPSQSGKDPQNGRLIRITYVGYSCNWDEWISEFSPRIKPHGQETHRPKKSKYGDLQLPNYIVMLFFINRRLLPLEVYVFRKEEAQTMGFPVMMLHDSREGITNKMLYEWVWLRLKKFSRGTIESEHPFILKKVREDRVTCSICEWDRGCSGCPILCDSDNYRMDSLCIAIDWNEKFYRQYMDHAAILANGVVDHPSVSENREDMNKKTNISECIQKFTIKEPVEGVYCSNCRRHDEPANKTLQLWSGSKILVIHLKRLVTGRQKYNHLIEFPFELDLRPHLAPSSKNPTTKEKTRVPQLHPAVLKWYQNNQMAEAIGVRGPDPPIYDLFAVIDHLGGSSGGHYVCKAISPNPKASEAGEEKLTWCLFNDKTVTQIEKENVCTRQAYMLFYCRRDGRSKEESLTFMHEKPKVREATPDFDTEVIESTYVQRDTITSPDTTSFCCSCCSCGAKINTPLEDEEQAPEYLSPEQEFLMAKKRNEKYTNEEERNMERVGVCIIN